MVNWIIYFIVRLFDLSFRYRFQNPEVLENLPNSLKGNYLFAIWHKFLFGGILAQTGKKHVVIISKSKDAEPVALLCKRLGHKVARGSSRSVDNRDKGGKAAMEEMVEVLKSGLPGAITVDGPKGPAEKVKPGIVLMAQKTGLPIVPYVPIPRNYWEFNSWDKFRLPKPFSTIDIYYGNPIDVSELTIEAAQKKIESALLEVEKTNEDLE